MLNSQLNKYQVASENTSKVKQLIMLYDGIIKFLYKAQQAVEKEEISERFNYINKAINIINSLQLALDEERGGEVAVVLERFYDEMIIKLHVVNIQHQSVNEIEHIITQFRKIKSVWCEIEQQLAGTQHQDLQSKQLSDDGHKMASMTIKV